MQRFKIFVVKCANHAADFLVFSVAFAAGHLVCYISGFLYDPLIFGSDFRTLASLFLVYYFINYFFLSLSGVYPTKRFRSLAHMCWFYFRSIYMALIPINIIGYTIYPIDRVSALFLVSSTCAFVLMILKEFCIRRVLFYFRKAGFNLHNVILIGHDEKMIRDIVGEVESDSLLGLNIIGRIDLSDGLQSMAGLVPCLGTVKDFERILNETVVDCVIFLEQPSADDAIKDMIWECEQRGVEIWLELSLFDGKIGKVDVEHLKNVPFLNCRSGPQNAPALMVKYALDRIMSLLLLILFSPFFLVIAVVIKTTSPGPIFFKQYRASINGRKFVFYKFRSMVNNAEQFKESLKAKNEMEGPVFKMKDDPRITPVGKFLRKTSLDELPQLWNVLRGDMSLVGPRPPLPSEVVQYKGWQRRRLSMKPGITCIWQVEGRNKITDFSDWAKLDLKYIDEWSLWLDLKLLFKTIPAVMKQTGL